MAWRTVAGIVYQLCPSLTAEVTPGQSNSVAAGRAIPSAFVDLIRPLGCASYRLPPKSKILPRCFYIIVVLIADTPNKLKMVRQTARL